ncbi:hypothetical protein BZM27_53270 [Paraburkholderia steynii]|uniref:Uncharacterized protein n=1 Tax=Paraburkholderia steynii TaxID=1245441 RepID=A0A4R0XA84_9BURK|nr:hypothetical protein BZM27_53270 [Paraburkholderia steynii]
MADDLRLFVNDDRLHDVGDRRSVKDALLIGRITANKTCLLFVVHPLGRSRKRLMHVVNVTVQRSQRRP